MGYIIKMPKMGLEMEEGEVVSWEVETDEPVESGDVIAVVESEKAANDVEARESGIVRQIIAGEGSVAEPGDPIGILSAPDEDISALVEETKGASSEDSQVESASSDQTEASVSAESDSGASTAGASTAADIKATPGAKELAAERGVALTEVTATGPQGTVVESDVEDHASASAGSTSNGESASSNVKATPGAKSLAQEEGVDLTDVTGTGPQGTIVESDVAEHTPASESADGTESVSSGVKATPGAKDRAREKNIDLADISGSGPQGVVTEADVADYAEKAADKPATVESGESPAAVDFEPANRTIQDTRDLSSIQQTVSDRMSESDQNAAHVTLKRSYDADVLLKIIEVSEAAGVDVSLNDVLVRAVGAGLAAHPEFNALFEDGTHQLVEEVNIGVAVDVENGLLTPVVPRVASRSVEDVSQIRGELTDRALSGDYSMDDMSGRTFTITNLGMFGIDSFDPIINPPEIAILGVGRIKKDGRMTLSLSFDHRVVNGADAARLLDTIVGHLTDPKALIDFFEADLFKRYVLES